MAFQKPDPQNAVIAVEDGLVVIRINPEIRLGPSSSGKTTLVAKASFDVPGYPGMSVSLTAYTK